LKRITVVSYAINGRGMGHLVRQLAILRQLRRVCALLDVRAECWVLTSSEADTLARREGFVSLKMPSKAMMRDAGIPTARYLAVARSWVHQTIAGLQPDLLLVDTFPAGSFGELISVLEMARRRVLVARRVRPEVADNDAYAALLPLYHDTIVPDAAGVGPILIRDRDELVPEDLARAELGIPAGRRAVYVSLGGGGDLNAPGTLPRLVDRLVAADWHVVVAAGPLYQGPARRGPGITWLDRYLPVELMPGLDVAISAAGYNSYHELMMAGVPTIFLPQPRISDDQEERARRADAAGAGRVATSLDHAVSLLTDPDCAPGDSAAARALVPENGALPAALAALDGLLPAADLAMARQALVPEVRQLLRRAEGPGQQGTLTRVFNLIRLFSGGTPAEIARRRAALLELADAGHKGALDTAQRLDTHDPAPNLRRFVHVCDTVNVPLDIAARLVESLRRKFPAATPGPLIDAVEVLFPCWARFDDWMGAISLMRAVPTQRTLTITRFATQIAAWLQREDDLFDALRRYSHLEDGGTQSVAEVLIHLERPQ
jgi:UDP-N-acetylglucosamine--N-acetylmuramyl-(pentapeptide) pyrophosphoryl-undecaprenol N-acetylglucosamine transferase